MAQMDEVKDMGFSINPVRLRYLLELYKLSKEEFLVKLQGANKYPVLELEGLNEVLDGNRKVNISLLKKLDSIVPLASTVDSKEVSIYQLDEKKGTISKLNNYEGIPSDKNLLNESLSDGNNLFDSLLEIEQEL